MWWGSQVSWDIKKDKEFISLFMLLRKFPKIHCTYWHWTKITQMPQKHCNIHNYYYSIQYVKIHCFMLSTGHAAVTGTIWQYFCQCSLRNYSSMTWHESQSSLLSPSVLRSKSHKAEQQWRCCAGCCTAQTGDLWRLQRAQRCQQ